MRANTDKYAIVGVQMFSLKRSLTMPYVPAAKRVRSNQYWC